ncbi:glycosyltransferase family 4 protein [Arcobacter arenosus]|uniref:Glycosyltransferase family 4 protein n=1 Tax=Arcobacter arenosus TaxID=2576037 RepID=A0A5R8Y0N3_9BACT|nr:glycosyltransferase family 4 protein [Arcobacter arenosus]TLP37770.1 glycosyltransferase family 4 protein [Arcobacter arenosus]
MKKILFVVNVDWFFVSHRLPLALKAIEKGYEVHLSCALTDKKDYLEDIGLKVHPLNLSRSSVGLKGEIKTFFGIYNTLKEISPDIVHFVTIKPVLYGGLCTKFLNIDKKVFSISGLGFLFIKEGVKASFVRSIIKTIYRIVFSGNNTHIIVQNPDDKSLVNSITKAPTTLIRGSGVNLKEYKYFKENCENVKVTMACRLLKDKGVFEYIEAAKMIKQKFPMVEFGLYGDTDIYNPASLTNEEVDKIKKDKIVEIYGFNKYISKIFSDSNIIVLPSYREGLPKVLIEAAACGRAVVTTDVPGCRDAIEVERTGLLSKVKDPKSLAESIERLIQDNELRNSMGKAGRELAEQEFDINKVVEKHFEIYES